VVRWLETFTRATVSRNMIETSGGVLYEKVKGGGVLTVWVLTKYPSWRGKLRDDILSSSLCLLVHGFQKPSFPSLWHRRSEVRVVRLLQTQLAYRLRLPEQAKGSSNSVRSSI
jgi:hypothetical protein